MADQPGISPAAQPGISPAAPAEERHPEVRPGRALPGWRSVLAVVAHPDDETFGLGAVIDAMTTAGSAVHVLCFTHGEASTLNERVADLGAARAAELAQASAELGVAGYTLLGYPDTGLPEIPQAELKAEVTGLAARHRADGLLVFDDTGITGHADHKAATAAALTAAGAAGLPVLAWTIPAAIASQLQAETGAPFAGRPAGQVDLCVRIDRTRQRRAALLHASQVSPAAVLWRRLQLQGDCEHLRWIEPGGSACGRSQRTAR
jgi:LmbE family N-acetylglucosaminyl deacetylase